MADVEFEEFCRYFEEVPQHIKASNRTYTLVHDIILDEDTPVSITNFKSCSIKSNSCQSNRVFDVASEKCNDDNETCDIHFSPKRCCSTSSKVRDKGTRRLSENFKNQRVYETPLSLAEEFENALANVHTFVRHDTLSHFRSKHSYITDTVYSPDSEFCDSGNSTAHSPDDSLIPGSVNGSNNGSFTHLELLEATHRALYKFIARHSDELELEIGDPIYVQKEAEDLWYEGINLRNGNRGIFPSAYVVDVEYNDFDPSAPQMKRERFVVRYLGSVETLYHKGNSVLCQAVHKIRSTNHKYHSCVLEVSDQGLKMYDRIKPGKDDVPTLDYFYSLKNVSFCGFHPHDSRFMGFITKHPRYSRFACHVFQSNDSTRPITESIGRAFQRFYQKYIETAYPIEDIYIE